MRQKEYFFIEMRLQDKVDVYGGYPTEAIAYRLAQRHIEVIDFNSIKNVPVEIVIYKKSGSKFHKVKSIDVVEG